MQNKSILLLIFLSCCSYYIPVPVELSAKHVTTTSSVSAAPKRVELLKEIAVCLNNEHHVSDFHFSGNEVVGVASVAIDDQEHIISVMSNEFASRIGQALQKLDRPCPLRGVRACATP